MASMIKVRFHLRDTWYLCCSHAATDAHMKHVRYPPLPWSEMEAVLVAAEASAALDVLWEAVEESDLGWWIKRAPEPETVEAGFAETKAIESGEGRDGDNA